MSKRSDLANQLVIAYGSTGGDIISQTVAYLRRPPKKAKRKETSPEISALAGKLLAAETDDVIKSLTPEQTGVLPGAAIVVIDVLALRDFVRLAKSFAGTALGQDETPKEPT